jgi:U3 small nucleolar RNA-associated protein 13
VLRVRFLSSGLQLISSGADGLLKLWTIRTNECDATMDGHNDKVWALDITPGCEEIVSGGADSKLVVWEDTTKEVEDAKQVEDAQAILMDQSLANHLRNKEYAKALNIALKRDKPHHALKVLSAMIEEDLAKGQSGLVSLKKEAVTWSDEHLISILRYCREWNTRALNSNIAMATCKAIVSTIPAYKLAALDGVPEILAGIIPYSERHFDRLDRLYASTYLLDFALSSMGSIEAPNDGEFAEWESQSKLVLPPTSIDGRIQIGGLAVVGTKVASPASKIEANDSDVIITVGDSDSSDEDE